MSKRDPKDRGHEKRDRHDEDERDDRERREHPTEPATAQNRRSIVNIWRADGMAAIPPRRKPIRERPRFGGSCPDQSSPLPVTWDRRFRLLHPSSRLRVPRVPSVARSPSHESKRNGVGAHWSKPYSREWQA